MSFSSMPWYAWVAIAWFVSDLIQKGIKSRRDERIAQVEAEMKLKLAREITNPELVERLLKSRIRVGPDGSWESDDDEAMEAAMDPGGRVRISAEIGATSQGSAEERVGHFVLGGLVAFLMGGAFILAAQPFCADIQALWIPGLILGAVGLALLTYATMQKDIRRHTGFDTGESPATEHS